MPSISRNEGLVRYISPYLLFKQSEMAQRKCEMMTETIQEDCTDFPETIPMIPAEDTESSTFGADPDPGIPVPSRPFAEELSAINEFTQPDAAELEHCKLLLGRKSKRLTLVLDLDQTLVYSVPVENTTGDCNSFTVKVRPFAEELVRRLSEKFELVVFTAAEAVYAHAVVALLDPLGE